MAVPTRFVLLGTNHPLHFGIAACPGDKVEAFTGYVQELCRSAEIKHLAEEASADALQSYSVHETVASRIARERGLTYTMIDLMREERSRLAIADDQLAHAAMSLTTRFNVGPLRERLDKISNQVREGVWVARTLEADTWPTLLIVGANHVTGVEKLVRSLRQTVVVAHRDYEP
jgi:hypothetical protein